MRRAALSLIVLSTVFIPANGPEFSPDLDPHRRLAKSRTYEFTDSNEQCE